jgi:hypothetical protein
MAKIKGLKLSQEEVSQTLNLNELFGANLSGNSALVQEIGQAIIDKIISRTEAGKSVDGTKLKSPYSKMYSESLEFKAFGKSKNKVNMTLTGSMIGTIDILESRGGKLKIGWSDAEENAKAYNHNAGDTVPRRAFFGLNEKELQEIKKEFDPIVKEESKSLQSEKQRVAVDLITRLSPRSAFQFDVGDGENG